MRQQTTNTFNEGLMMDLNPLTTPSNVITDAVNATLITFNGNEFVLQNDMGNCKVERAKLSPGFIPVGMQEYGGIVYVASFNPETGEDEIGSFPSPERDFSTSDYDNIGAINFRTSQFKVATTLDTKEKTSVIKKLVEPELLQLNPGDMYVVVYDVNDVIVNSSESNEIDTNDKMENFISKDPLNRKLFKLKFYKITDDNNLTDMKSDDIKVIQNQEDIEDEYVYFKENSKGTIAIGLELEEMDLFDINVIDTSRKTIAKKRATIEAIGASNSLAEFKGVRVDLSLPEIQTFFIEKTGLGKKVSALLDDLKAGETLSGSVTPYSNYSLYPKLKKDFQLELGKYASAGSGVNNIFRYYIDNNYVKVDFDFKFEGDNPDGLHLYIEFYDPWSDYSIIKTIDNPTYYGINSVTMELVDEPTTDIFNKDTQGGTPKNLLIDNGDKTFEKTLLNKSGLIRTTTALRRNHFYIVRISGIDKDLTVDPITFKHYDLYKGMYTTTMYNNIYTKQLSVREGDPQYVDDFNKLDFNLDEVKYVATVKESNNISLPKVVLEREDLMTGGKYYKILDSPAKTTPAYKHTKVFQNNRDYNINLILTGTDKVFGQFKTELVTIDTPELVDTNQGVGLKAEITDINYDNNPNIDPDSYATWSIEEIADNQYKLATKSSTKRTVHAGITTANTVAKVYEEVSMLPQLHYKPLGDGPFPTNRKATVQYFKYDINVVKNNGSVHYSSHGDTDDRNLAEDMRIATGDRFSAAILTSNEKTWFYPVFNEYHSCCSSDPNGTAPWKQSMLIVRDDDAGVWRGTRTHDVAVIEDFFKKLMVASNVDKRVVKHYPNVGDIQANGNITTRFEYPDVDLVSRFTPQEARTYLSTILFKAKEQIVDFSTTEINNYIASRMGDSVIVDGKKTLRDGFIPYISQEKTSVATIDIPTIEITEAADSSVIDRMVAGEGQANSDPIFNEGRYSHGTLFTDEPAYQRFASMFKVVGIQATNSINAENVKLTIASSSNLWTGAHSRVCRCDGDGDRAIDILVDLTINKP